MSDELRGATRPFNWVANTTNLQTPTRDVDQGIANLVTVNCKDWPGHRPRISSVAVHAECAFEGEPVEYVLLRHEDGQFRRFMLARLTRTVLDSGRPYHGHVCWLQQESDPVPHPRVILERLKPEVAIPARSGEDQA
jgi:hypothetical protein